MRTTEQEIRRAASLAILRWRAQRRKERQEENNLRWRMRDDAYKNGLAEGQRQGLQEALGIHKSELDARLRDAIWKLAKARFGDGIAPALQQLTGTLVDGPYGRITSMLDLDVSAERSLREIDVLQVRLSLPALQFVFAVYKG